MAVVLACLAALAVTMTLPSSTTQQMLKCPSGQRLYTPDVGPDICEDCDPGTFIKVSSHSERTCSVCSTCAAFVARSCNVTSDTVCCPYPDMSVVDTEAGAYCTSAESQHKSNHSADDNGTYQVSDCEGIHNRSDSAALPTSNKDMTRLIGHIVAMLALLSMSVHTLTQVRVCYKWCVIICGTGIITVIFSLVENDAEDVGFLVCVICCIVIKIHHPVTSHPPPSHITSTTQSHHIHHPVTSHLKSCVGKLTEVTQVSVSTPATSCDDADEIPESQSSDPLLGAISIESSELARSSQDDPRLSPGGSLYKHDTDDPDVSVDCRPDSGAELLTTQAAGPVSRHASPTTQAAGPVSGHASPTTQAAGPVSRHASPTTQAAGPVSRHVSRHTSPTAEAKTLPGASELMLEGQSSEQKYGCKFSTSEEDDNFSDMPIDTPASVRLSVSGSCDSTQPIKLTSNSVESHTAKAGESGHTPGVQDDDNHVERTELLHDQLALKFRSESNHHLAILTDHSS